MTFELLLTAALDIAFFALVALTLRTYLRERTAVARDTFLVFASVAVVLAVPLLRQVVPAIPPAATTVATVFILAQPALSVLLISHFREGMRPIVAVAFVLFVISSFATVALRPVPPALGIGILAYFAVFNALAALFFALEGRRRIGGGRTRLRLAAAGSLLFAIAILVVGAASVLRPPAPGGVAQPDPLISTVTRVLALLAAICYLAAFAPPGWLRRLWQRSVAYEYLRDLVLTPPDGDRDALWSRLATAARRVTGARASAVAVGPAAGDVEIRAADGEWSDPSAQQTRLPQATLAAGSIRGARFGREVDRSHPGIARLVAGTGARRVLSLPIEVDRETQGGLLLFATQSPLFVEDDLALLGVLNAHTARAVQRENALAERGALVEQLRRMNAELSHASSAKSDFLAAMSHELRTPLHAIIGFSELLVSPADGDGSDPTVREFAGHIHGAGLHLLDLINDVLDMAKVEAGRLDLHQEVFDLSALAHRTVRTMQPLASRKRIALSYPSPTGVQVRADAARIRQVLFNLVSNAVKFTPEDGKVDVAIAQRDGEVRLSVADTGRGIPKDDQARIFEPFQQSEQGDADRQEGTGLGLALTRQLVEAHGGHIELESELGHGSRFTVVLPATEAIPSEVPALPAASAERPRTRAPLVLVVEDDTRAAELLSIYLRGAGYEVAVATDGVTGVTEAHRLQPAAIILDVILPVLDGWEVLRQLKADPATEAIPVVIVSVVEDAELGFALGAVDYLVKPVRSDLLLAELERLAAGGRTRTGALTLLAIDDDPTALDLYAAELEPAGFRVLRADGGEPGIAMAVAERPDVILLDLVMPGVDGWQVAARLQAASETADIPILVVTSHDLSAAEKQRLQGQVRQVLTKGPDARARLLGWLTAVTARDAVAGGPPASEVAAAAAHADRAS